MGSVSPPHVEGSDSRRSLLWPRLSLHTPQWRATGVFAAGLTDVGTCVARATQRLTPSLFPTSCPSPRGLICYPEVLGVVRRKVCTLLFVPSAFSEFIENSSRTKNNPRKRKSSPWPRSHVLYTLFPFFKTKKWNNVLETQVVPLQSDHPRPVSACFCSFQNLRAGSPGLSPHYETPGGAAGPEPGVSQE